MHEVVIHNGIGGPRAAGEALRIGKFSKDVASAVRLWDEILIRYGRSVDIGPKSFAAQSVQADPGADEARLREDAVAAVAEFIRALR